MKNMETKQRFLFVNETGNKKTGPIPVVYSSSNTCPSACPWKAKGCYAKIGPCAIHWHKLDKRGKGLSAVLAGIKQSSGSLMRYGVAGDLPGVDNHIDAVALAKLANTARLSNVRAYAYTHKPTLKGKHARGNRSAIKKANLAAAQNKKGLTINLSADNLNRADQLAALNIAPVVVILPLNTPHKLMTPQGRSVILCPAQRDKDMTCDKCKLCQVASRKAIIGFEAHGVQKKFVSAMCQS